MTIMEHIHSNGSHTRGRTVPPLPEHTFKDSGITIKIRKVGPTTQQRLVQAIQKDDPEPQPPVVETELGSEPNAADPTYLTAHAEWRQKVALEVNNRMMKFAALEAEVAIDDAARGDIARKKRNLELIGMPYSDDPSLTDQENERVFYILNVAIATPEDLRDFSSAIMRRSVPTEEAVQAQIATFQRDV